MMKSKNSEGPRTDPCGTPDRICTQLETLPLTAVDAWGNLPPTLEGTDRHDSLFSSKLCETLSHPPLPGYGFPKGHGRIQKHASSTYNFVIIVGQDSITVLAVV